MMIQNILIGIIILICAWYVGRRIYRSLNSSQKGGGCGCGCTDCGTDLVSQCPATDKTETDCK